MKSAYFTKLCGFIDVINENTTGSTLIRGGFMICPECKGIENTPCHLCFGTREVFNIASRIIKKYEAYNFQPLYSTSSKEKYYCFDSEQKRTEMIKNIKKFNLQFRPYNNDLHYLLILYLPE